MTIYMNINSLYWFSPAWLTSLYIRTPPIHYTSYSSILHRSRRIFLAEITSLSVLPRLFSRCSFSFVGHFIRRKLRERKQGLVVGTGKGGRGDKLRAVTSCMSVDCVETYCGGIGELSNPLQWPQLRKKRRFLLVALLPIQLPFLDTLLRLLARPMLHKSGPIELMISESRR